MSIVLDGTTGITTPALDSAAQFSSADMPAGSVIQTVHNVVSGNRGSGTQNIVQVAFTPKFSTSKVFITGHTCVYVPAGSTCSVDLYIDSTFLYRSAGGVGWGVNARNEDCSVNYLYQLSSGGGVTFTLQGLHISGGAPSWNYYDSQNTGNSSITIMEIAA